MFTYQKQALLSIKEHSERASPAECCGALLARDYNVIEARPLQNISTQRAHFEVDIFALDALYDEASRRGLSVIGIYHSHVEVGAYLSARDRGAAGAPPTYNLYLVAGVRRGSCDEIKSFAWRGDDFIEERLL